MKKMPKELESELSVMRGELMVLEHGLQQDADALDAARQNILRRRMQIGELLQRMKKAMAAT